MSYDLSVYTAVPVNAAQIAALVAASPGLAIGEGSQNVPGPSGFFTVSRGKRQAYCFTVEGPFGVEPEDVPEEVTSAVLGAGHLYSVLVEGSADASVPHAIRFAKRLAGAGNGAVLDAQTEEVWPRTSRRKAARPERGTNIDVVEACWYLLLDEAPQDFPDQYLRIARRHLPEALPLRFGTYEPFQGKLLRDGDRSFTDLFREEDGVHASGAFPVFGSFFAGLFAGNPGAWYREGDVQRVSVNIDAASLTDPRWRQSFRRFFTDVAVESRCFHAAAEVNRGYAWNGRTLWSGTSEWRYWQDSSKGQWLGLAERPPWYSWFSPLYADLVRPHLTRTITEHRDGLFHSFAEDPVHHEQIRASLPGNKPWIPAELTVEAVGGAEQPCAETIPERLRQMKVPPPPKPDPGHHS